MFLGEESIETPLQSSLKITISLESSSWINTFALELRN